MQRRAEGQVGQQPGRPVGQEPGWAGGRAHGHREIRAHTGQALRRPEGGRTWGSGCSSQLSILQRVLSEAPGEWGRDGTGRTAPTTVFNRRGTAGTAERWCCPGRECSPRLCPRTSELPGNSWPPQSPLPSPRARRGQRGRENCRVLDTVSGAHTLPGRRSLGCRR